MQPNSHARRRPPLLIYTLLLSLTFVVYLVLIGLNYIFSSDIIFAGTLLAELTDLLYLAAEQFAFWIIYAYAIYRIFSYGIKDGLRYGAVYAVVTGLRHAVLYLLSYFLMGLRGSDLGTEAAFTLLKFALELIQYAVVFVIAALLSRRFHAKANLLPPDDAMPAREELVYPNRVIPFLEDPLRTSALLTALLTGGVRVLNRLIYDIDYGAPTDLVDALWMVLYYSTDILIGVATYFILLLFFRRLSSKQA